MDFLSEATQAQPVLAWACSRLWQGKLHTLRYDFHFHYNYANKVNKLRCYYDNTYISGSYGNICCYGNTYISGCYGNHTSLRPGATTVSLNMLSAAWALHTRLYVSRVWRRRVWSRLPRERDNLPSSMVWNLLVMTSILY